MDQYDIIIVGGGPCGLACGIEAEKNGYSYLILEKGTITEAIRHFPTHMKFFSTPELLELGDVPFTTRDEKPTRSEALKYYRNVVNYFNLNIEVLTEVSNVRKQGGQFSVQIESGQQYTAQHVILAIGYFDHPNYIDVPGEDLPHVSHYYDEPFKYAHTNVVVVGGKNSAVETSLELFRHEANVTLVHRRDQLGDSVKYWIEPDIKNRIKEGSIRALFNTEIKEIRKDEVTVINNQTEEKQTLPADYVLLLTGYHPDIDFLKRANIEIEDETLIPNYNPDTFETNVEDLYVAGSAACGCEISNIFIENGRQHAQAIFEHLQKKEEVSTQQT